MKVFFMMLCFCVQGFAVSPNEFLKLDDQDKIDFLQEKTTEIYDEKELQKLLSERESVVADIVKTGESLSDIWGDTVLEGPYVLTGDVEVSISSAYVYEGHIYGFYAVASAPAIHTDTCDYDEDTQQWGDDCTEGFITEAFFVDANGQWIESDNYADFDN